MQLAPTFNKIDNRIFIDLLPDGTQRIQSDLKDDQDAAVEILRFTQMGQQFGGNGGQGPIQTGPTVQEVARQFADEVTLTGDWGKDKTCSQGMSRLEVIVEMLGPNKVFAALTRKDLLLVRNRLMKRIDPDRTRRSPRNGMMAAETARSYFQLCKRLFLYALDQDLISSDCTARLSIKVKSSAVSSYKPFKPDDVSKIVNRSIYHSKELTRQRRLDDSYFWGPLLALYTGGRINEICQLCLTDISFEYSEETDEKIWFIDINDDEIDQSAKTESSKRRVPIHSELLAVGFLDFHAKRCREAQSGDKLFADVKRCKTNGWGRETGRWFNGETASLGHLDSLGLGIRDNKTFHSFRHTAARRLRRKGVDEADIAATVGHEHKTTTRRYGDGYTLDRLQQVIEKLDYGVDLSHISFEKFEDYKICKGRPQKNKHLLYTKLKSK